MSVRPEFPWRIVGAVLLIISAFGLLGSWFWLRRIPESATAPAPSAFSNGPRSRVELPRLDRSLDLRQAILNITSQFQVSDGPEACRTRFVQLRQVLAQTPRTDAATAIKELLDSKVDAVSHLPFMVGSDGFLQESPSLRVFLLDYLAQVDPAGAAAYARIILATMDSPDEWAVALRNLARGDTSNEGRALLKQKTGELLRHEPWQQDPSVGFLEAFDVAVYLGGTNLIPTLTELVRMKDNQAAAHAAYLALDRLTISDAAMTLFLLEANLELMKGREETRANYFARADVRETGQRQLLEAYLLNPALGTVELEKFAGLYPNANFMVSKNLLTPVVTPDRTSLTARDAEALRVVGQWIADPRFGSLKPQLETVQRRLEIFVREAGRSP